eukprot:15377479-Heterocapsa_arctica.AAC.1
MEAVIAAEDIEGIMEAVIAAEDIEGLHSQVIAGKDIDIQIGQITNKQARKRAEANQDRINTNKRRKNIAAHQEQT